MTDPQLAYDAAQFRLLLESPAWEVLKRYIELAREDYLKRMSDYRGSDQAMHHWRGGYVALDDLLALPGLIIDAEKRQRAGP